MSLTICIFIILCMSFSNIQGLNETCSKNADCPITENTVCLNNVCNCDVLSYFNKKTCLTYATEFQSYCEEDDQCAFLGSNKQCKNNLCICEDKYRWIQGKCLPYVGKTESCKEDIDCYDGYDLISLSCIKGICDCTDGFYDRGLDCRNMSKLGGECMIDIDCQTEGLICKRGKCITNAIEDENEYEDEMIVLRADKYRYLLHSDALNTCDFDDDCINIGNSECINKSCQCKSGHYLNKGNCLSGISSCQKDSDCTVDNSFCFKSATCICKQGYFFDKTRNTCISELGMESDHCNIQASVLIDGACQCRNYWYTNDNNRNCIKTTTQEMKTCVTNDFCDALGPYSFCNLTDSINGICMCSSFAELNENYFYCEKISEQPQDVCLRDKDCSLNEKCLNEKCVCVKDFTKNKDGICLPNIGGSCEITSCSHINNSKCIGGICGCATNYIGQDSVCLKMADQLHDECEVDAQCANLKHSICDSEENNGNNTCVCDVDYVEVSLRSSRICMADKKYGSPCMNSTDCSLVLNRSYECRNSLCQCAVGKVLKNGYCTGGSSHTYAPGKLILTFLSFFVIFFKVNLM